MAYDIKKLENESENIAYVDKNEEDVDLNNDIFENLVFYVNLIEMKKKLNQLSKYLLKHPYMIFIFTIFIDFMNYGFDKFIFLKLYALNIIHSVKEYLNLNSYIEEIILLDKEKIMNIKHNHVKELNKEMFHLLFNGNNMILDDESCILIKYVYEEVKYRLYVEYKNIQNKTIKLSNYIKNNAEYNKKNVDKDTLHLFNNECNQISYATINDNDVKEIIEQCNGPFYDFGILNNHKVYIKYILKELNIDNFEKLEIKYTNFHLDEDEMELKEHIIKINDKDKYIISDIIQKYIVM